MTRKYNGMDIDLVRLLILSKNVNEALELYFTIYILCSYFFFDETQQTRGHKVFIEMFK